MACEGGVEEEELWKGEGSLGRRAQSLGGRAPPEFIDISVLEEQRLAPPLLSPEGALPPAENTDSRDAPTLDPPWFDEESLRVVAFVPFSKPLSSPEIPLLEPENQPVPDDRPCPSLDDRPPDRLGGELSTDQFGSTDSRAPEEQPVLLDRPVPELIPEERLQPDSSKDETGEGVEDTETPVMVLEELPQSEQSSHIEHSPVSNRPSTPNILDKSSGVCKKSDTVETSLQQALEVSDNSDNVENIVQKTPALSQNTEQGESILQCPEVVESSSTRTISDLGKEVRDISCLQDDLARLDVDILKDLDDLVQLPELEQGQTVQKSTNSSMPAVVEETNSETSKQEEQSDAIEAVYDSPMSPDDSERGLSLLNHFTDVAEEESTPDSQVKLCDSNTDRPVPETLPETDSPLSPSPNTSIVEADSLVEEEPCVGEVLVKGNTVTPTAIATENSIVQTDNDLDQTVTSIPDREPLDTTDLPLEDCTSNHIPSPTIFKEELLSANTNLQPNVIVKTEIEEIYVPMEAVTNLSNNESLGPVCVSDIKTEPETSDPELCIATVKVIKEEVRIVDSFSITSSNDENLETAKESLETASEPSIVMSEPTTEVPQDALEQTESELPSQEQEKSQEQELSNGQVKNVVNTGCCTELEKDKTAEDDQSLQKVVDNNEKDKFVRNEPPLILEKSPIASLQKAVRKIDPKKGFGSKINSIDVIAEKLGVKTVKRKEEKREKKQAARDMQMMYPYKTHPMMVGSHPPIMEFSAMMPPPLPCQMPYMPIPPMMGGPMVPGMPYPGPCFIAPRPQTPSSKLVQVQYYSGAGLKTKIVEVPNIPIKNSLPQKDYIDKKSKKEDMLPSVQKAIANRTELEVMPLKRSSNPLIPEVTLEEGLPNGHFKTSYVKTSSMSGGRYLDVAEAPVRCDSLVEKRPSPKPSSEEIVFNSTDLKVILVQPESDLHSSKKSQHSEDGDRRKRAKIRGKKRGSLESVCEKLTQMKGEQRPELELSVVKRGEAAVEPREAPEIVLLPKELNGNDPLVSIVKVPRAEDGVNGMTKPTVVNVTHPAPRNTGSKRGRKRLSLVSTKTSPVVQQQPVLPESTLVTSSQEVVLSNRLSNCGGKVLVGLDDEMVAKLPAGLSITAKEPAREPVREVVDTRPEAADPERKAAIDRLKRLGTEVCLEEERPSSGGSASSRTDTVLVAPGTAEAEPRALEMLECMATSRALPVSPVLTALGHTVMPAEVKKKLAEDMVPITKVTLQQHLAQTQQQLTQQSPSQLVQQLTQQVVQQTTQHVIQQTTQSVVHQTTQQVVQHTTQQVVQQTSQQVVQTTTQQSVQPNPQPIVEKTPQQRQANPHQTRQSLQVQNESADDSPTMSVDGLFVFKAESYALDNGSFKCDICTAVYSHANALRKHYLRLHIARHCIAQRDLEMFNIDLELTVSEGCLRCHVCRLSFNSKGKLRNHLTAHPGIVERPGRSDTRKGPRRQYTCPRCAQVFKWRKLFRRHRRVCRDSNVSTRSKSVSTAASAAASSSDQATTSSKKTNSVTIPSAPSIKVEDKSDETSPPPTTSPPPVEPPSLDVSAISSNISIESATGESLTAPSSPLADIPIAESTLISDDSSYTAGSSLMAGVPDDPDIPEEPVKSPPEDTGPPSHHCLYCNETFRSAYRKKNHILSQHPYIRRKHTCVFCQKVLQANNMALFVHLLTEHADQYFGCQTCKERFASPAEVRSHWSKLHPDEPVPPAQAQLDKSPEYFQCERCERTFLIQRCLNTHACSGMVDRSKDRLPKKIPRPVELRPRTERLSLDSSGDFFSRVSANVRDNLLNFLDGKLGSTINGSDASANGRRPILNFSAAVGSTSAVEMTPPVEPTVSSTQPAKPPAWEKFNFPKEYDGRCGLTSYIKDTSYLDLSTQLIMRRNLQRLNLLKDESPDAKDDVPGVLALERLAAQTAESYGVAETTTADDSEGVVEAGILSGEWVRDHTYVCSVCRWENTCLWTMEDHKYTVHPHVCAPHHEIQGPDHSPIIETVYKRLVTDPPSGSMVVPQTPSRRVKFECTKCQKSDIRSQKDLHRHVVECAGEDLPALEAAFIVAAGATTGRSRRRPRWRRGGRRSRQGLKRTVPSTPPAARRPPVSARKLVRTKPGDSETIEKMIANLPAKRATRRVLGFDEIDLKTRSQSTIQNVGSMQMPSLLKKNSLKAPGKVSPPSRSPGIDTSAERGDVLSSLRMMPVRKRPVEEDVPPMLEIPPPPVAAADIPVLSPEPTPETDAEVVANKRRGRPFGSKNRLQTTTTKVIVKTLPGSVKGMPKIRVLNRIRKKVLESTSPSTAESSAKPQDKKTDAIQKKTEGTQKKSELSKKSEVSQKKTEAGQKRIDVMLKKVESAQKKADLSPASSKKTETSTSPPKKADLLKKKLELAQKKTETTKADSPLKKSENTSKKSDVPLKESDSQPNQSETNIKSETPEIKSEPSEGAAKLTEKKTDTFGPPSIDMNLSSSGILVKIEPEESEMAEEVEEGEGQSGWRKRKRRRKKSCFTHVKKHCVPKKEEMEIEPLENEVSLTDMSSPPAKRMRKSERKDVDEARKCLEAEEAKEMFEEAKRLAEESKRLFEETKKAKAEEDKKRKEEEKKRGEEKKLKAEEEKKRKEEEKRLKAEEEKKRKEEEKKKADEEKKLRIEEEKKRKDEEKRKAEEEKKRKDEERKQKILEEKKRKEEEKLRKEEEKERKKKLEEERKKKLEEEKKKKAEEDKKKKIAAEEEKKKRLEEEREKKRKAEEEKKKKAEEEKKRKAEEEKKRKAEEEKKRKADEEKKRKADEEKKRKAEEEKKRKAEEEERRRKAQEEEDERLRLEEEEFEKKRMEAVEKKRVADEERRRKQREAAEERKRKREEDLRKRREEEQLKKRREEEELKKRRDEEERKKKEEEERLEEEKKKKADEERDRKRKLDEEKKRKAEEERERKRRKVAEEEKRLKEEEERRIREEEVIRRLEEEKLALEEENRRIEEEERRRSEGGYCISAAGDDRRDSIGDDDTSSVGDESEEASSEDSGSAGRRVRMRKRKVSLVKRLMRKKSKAKMSPTTSASARGREVVRTGGGMTWEVESVAVPPVVSEEPILEPTWTQPTLQPLPPVVSTPPLLAMPQHPPIQQPTLAPMQQAQPVWRDPTPSLGSILDSVNTLLNEPDLTYPPIGLPQYSLADLQKAMGASDAEMAVLQQLGEASLHLVKTEESRPEEEEWPEIMDLDRQPPPEEIRPWQQAQQPPPNQYHPPFVRALRKPLPLPLTQESPATSRRSRSSTTTTTTPPIPRTDGNEALLAALPGKEVVCPTCCSHFMGFPALQNHINRAHPPGSASQDYNDPPSPTGSGKLRSRRSSSGSNSSKQELGNMNTRAVLETAKESRLVCCSCQLILPANLMPGHLAVEHNLPKTDVAKCQAVNSFQGSVPTQYEQPANVGGERLKNKMSSALGDLLERAVNNLLSAKDGNNRMSGGAIQLLNRLCALKKRDGASHHRLHPTAKEMLFKLNAKNRLEEAMSNLGHPPRTKPPTKSYQCGICGAKFMWESTWNQHVINNHINKTLPGTSSASSTEPLSTTSAPSRLTMKQRLTAATKRAANLREPDDSDCDDPAPLGGSDWRESGDESQPESEPGGLSEESPSLTHICSDCGLGFESIPELMTHRTEYHTPGQLPPTTPAFEPPPPPIKVEKPPPPVKTTGKTRGRSGGRGRGGRGGTRGRGRGGTGGTRGVRKSERRGVRLTHMGEESVREKAEAALRELNLCRKNKSIGLQAFHFQRPRWAPLSGGAQQSRQTADSTIYDFHEESPLF